MLQVESQEEKATFSEAESEAIAEVFRNPGGRPTVRNAQADANYFKVRALGKSVRAACDASGYNPHTVRNNWQRHNEEWQKLEAEAWELYLDSREDIAVEDEIANPVQARKTAAKHRPARWGEVAAEVKVTHVVDIEGALNDLAKLSGVSHLLEAPSGGTEGPASASALDADFTVIGEDKT